MDTVLDIAQIQRLLPHRYPFLLVDKVIEFEPGKRIVAIKNVTANEPFFQGHFPGAPVMPGVLIIEAMAQAGGLVLLGTIDDPQEKLLLFTGIEGAKFRKPVVPGDTLRLEMTLIRFKGRFCKLHGKAFVEDKLVAEAEVSSVLIDRSSIEAKPTSIFKPREQASAHTSDSDSQS
ncbi:MAG: 3-hydroxyacyl-ACP dehydratase FabZ [Acidobacteriota bacterium]|nr:3-hydroxyacyl-ACP dehydratase FabZ [Blastocatellia bacterium]MDW8412127.1 3-hydroxyacyl-ACP dehydratase FabZ [Acidobacteriota bacterium]